MDRTAGAPPAAFARLAVNLGLCLVLGGCGYDALPTRQARAEAALADLKGELAHRADLDARLAAAAPAPIASGASPVSEPAPAPAATSPTGAAPTGAETAMLNARRVGVERRIAVARRDYDEAARAYNAALGGFPSAVYARTLHAGARPMALSEALPAVRPPTTPAPTPTAPAPVAPAPVGPPVAAPAADAATAP